MNDDWSVLRFRMMVHHVSNSPPKLEQRVRERVRVTRPLRVVEQDHLAFLAVLQSKEFVFKIINQSQLHKNQIPQHRDTVVKKCCPGLVKSSDIN